jgi:hypothetical protein
LVAFFDSFSYWQKESYSFNESFIIEYAHLLNNARLTDFISFSPFLIACPFIIREDVKAVFQKFNIQEHYYIPINLYRRSNQKIDMNFDLMYCPMKDYDVIDFSQSSFYTGSVILGKKTHTFDTQAAFLEFQKNNPLLHAEKIVLNDSFNKKLDFFSLRIGGIYISQGLKDACVAEGFSGIKILEAKDPTIEANE